MSRNTTKAARLIILGQLQRGGYLAGRSLADIGRAMGVNRSTILRDLRDLAAVQPEIERLWAKWGAAPIPTVPATGDSGNAWEQAGEG